MGEEEEMKSRIGKVEIGRIYDIYNPRARYSCHPMEGKDSLLVTVWAGSFCVEFSMDMIFWQFLQMKPYVDLNEIASAVAKRLLFSSELIPDLVTAKMVTRRILGSQLHVDPSFRRDDNGKLTADWEETCVGSARQG